MPYHTDGDAIDLLGVTVHAFASPERLLARLVDGPPTRLAFANANLLYHAAAAPALRTALDGFLVVNDGIALDLTSRIACRKSFEANLNGTDFTPFLLQHLRPSRLFLYGARPAVVAAAVAQLQQRYPAHDIVGWQHGYEDAATNAALPARIRSSGAEVVLVALGNPAQELWLDAHFAATGAQLGLAVGAFFDFISGTMPRAPRAVRALKLEWAFRLLQEPRRLLRRYTVETGSVLYRAWQQRRSDAAANTMTRGKHQ